MSFLFLSEISVEGEDRVWKNSNREEPEKKEAFMGCLHPLIQMIPQKGSLEAKHSVIITSVQLGLLLFSLLFKMQ